MATGGGYLFLGADGSQYTPAGGTVFPGSVTTGGQFLAANGSVTAPAHSYTANATSGMYWDTGHGGGLAFSNQGVEFMYFDNTNAGIVMRPGGGTGVLFLNLGTNQLYVKQGDGSAYTSINADKFDNITNSTASACGFYFNSAGTGLYGNASTNIGLSVGGTSGLQMDANRRTSFLKQQVVTKTQAASPYSVATADSFTVFDNVGATGSVTFTLPAIGTANLGARVGFFVSAAQTVVVTANAADTIGTKAAGSSYTGAATKGNYLEAVATQGGWAVVSNTGFT